MDPLELVLMLGCLAWLLPSTWISRPITSGFWLVFNNLGVSQAMGPTVFYCIGLALLVCLMVRCLYARFIRHAFPPVAAGFLGAVTLFAGLYPLDFFISTASPFDFRACWWPFYVLSAFFVIVLYLNRTQSVRIAHMVALVAGIQGVCAIYFYFTGQHQFYTPHFGSRTGGTFASPNTLYPLLLLGVPLCIVLAEAQEEHRWKRVLFLSAAAANVLALNFTYMRSGWLGLAAAIVYLLVARRSAWTVYPWRRAAAICLLVYVVAAALFVRTRGEMIGTPKDRSTLGRFQIWAVSLHIINVHPWLGSGLSTYQAAQASRMTPALESFNPMNGEAKSLYLNTAAEFGGVGLALLLLVAWRYVRTVRATLVLVTANPEIGAILVGTSAGMIALAVAGLTDTPILNVDRAPGTFALALLVGAVAAIARDKLPASEGVAPVHVRGLRPAVGIILALALTLAAWTGGSSLMLIHRAMPKMDHYASKLADTIHQGMTQRPPERFEATLIAVEDRRFYQHHGVDWEALHAALRRDIRLGGAPQGGSTITMQAVRYALLPVDKTPTRKIAEIVLAERIEERLSKTDILRLYCDSVGFGIHTAGLTDAARFYFGKKTADLTLAECAFLVGSISRPPRSIQELTVSSTEQRKLFVLKRLEQMDTGRFDSKTLENARRERLRFAWKQASMRGEKVR